MINGKITWKRCERNTVVRRLKGGKVLTEYKLKTEWSAVGYEREPDGSRRGRQSLHGEESRECQGKRS